MTDHTSSHVASHQVLLSASAERVPAGHPFSLSWEAASSGAAVSSIQLASLDENGLGVVESIPDRGSRQMIVTRPGLVTFILTATFQDGVRCSKRIHVQVET